MKNLYQKTFDQIRMPEEQTWSLREKLASRCSQEEKEVNTMNAHKILRRPAALLVAALLVAALSITAFAACEYVVYQIKTGEIELPEDSIIYDWIDMEPDAILPYENFTEVDGNVTVTFDADEWSRGD